jgi:acetolactate synthase I/II/III large subunit
MNIQELATLAELNLNVKIIIFNNRHLGLVRQQQELFFGERYSASSFASGHDFAAIAAGFGIRSYSLERSEFDRIGEIMHTHGPALIDARIHPSANVLPIVPPGKANTETVYFSSEPESAQNEQPGNDIYDEPAV